GAVRFENVENLSGGSASDNFFVSAAGTLTGGISGGLGEDAVSGADKANAWTVTGAGAGTLNDVAFAGIESLVGGKGADRLRGRERRTVWRFTGSGTGQAGGTRFEGIETVEGSGSDTLDFSGYSTPVTVDIATAS